MATKRITISDIAKMAGVSSTAVSFVLNGKSGISKETRDKVHAIINATGFQPSVASRRLTSSKSFNIAVVYPKTASPFGDLFYYEVTQGVFERAQTENYNVVFTQLRGESPHGQLPDIILRKDADGVIFLQDIQPSLLDEMDAQGVPYVLVDIHTKDQRHTHVSVDCETSLRTMTEYLLSLGHRRIALLASDRIPYYLLNCLSGYQSAFAKHGLLIDPGWMRHDAHDEPAIASAVAELMAQKNPPSALCCTGDIVAVYAIKALKALGQRVPQDVSVISLDNLAISKLSDPALTTISFDNQSMGQTAAQLLFQLIAGQSAESIVLKSDELVVRDSVAPPKA